MRTLEHVLARHAHRQVVLRPDCRVTAWVVGDLTGIAIHVVGKSCLDPKCECPVWAIAMLWVRCHIGANCLGLTRRGNAGNPDDDVYVPDSFRIVRDSTGRNDTEGRDFCADLVTFTS